jgi:hypothetical protein
MPGAVAGAHLLHAAIGAVQARFDAVDQGVVRVDHPVRLAGGIVQRDQQEVGAAGQVDLGRAPERGAPGGNVRRRGREGLAVVGEQLRGRQQVGGAAWLERHWLRLCKREPACKEHGQDQYPGQRGGPGGAHGSILIHKPSRLRQRAPGQDKFEESGAYE